MTPWFVQVKEGERALVAFPHAGGGPASLGELAGHLPPEVGLWSVNLPGRQARLAEEPRTDLDGLVDELAHDLVERGPHTLFGYCSGALLAFLVCRRAVELGGRPERLIVASFAAPDVTLLLRRLPSLPSWLFWEQLIALGGVPAELADREALWPVLEPALRADFGLLAGYHHRPGPPLPVPISVLYGIRDASLTRGGLLGWRRQSVHRPALRELDSTHWLAEDTPDVLAAAIAEEMGCASVTA
ncbi:thioesterase II family protein [Microtetraspora malaysiensis]|uniref:Thioesterase II family protein n=1 Tax=Microtetraspora malaysiensis TaxID=161358 RepID=A0ABW6T4I1_9ACTN